MLDELEGSLLLTAWKGEGNEPQLLLLSALDNIPGTQM